MLCLRAPTTQVSLAKMKLVGNSDSPSRLSRTNCIADYVVLTGTNPQTKRADKRGRLAAPRNADVDAPLFGHAKRSCASEAYEPPFKFGTIVSSNPTTSSNST